MLDLLAHRRRRLVTCDAGYYCLPGSTNSHGFIGDQTVVSENFEGGTPGWSSARRSHNHYYSHFLGHYGGGESAEKTFSIDRTRGYVVKFDWYRLDSWDGETFRVWLNDQQVLQSPGFSGWAHIRDTKRGSSFGVSWTMDPDVGSWGGRWGRRMWNEQTFRVTLTVPANWASSDSLKVKVGSTLDQGRGDEA